MKGRPFRLELPMGVGSVPRTVFGDIMAGRWPNIELWSGGRSLGTLNDLWRGNDAICALLLLHAHDGWAEVARRRDVMAFAVEVEQREDGLHPIRVMADKAAFPLLALDQSIRWLARDNVCRLDDVIGFSGRWLQARGLSEPFTSPAPA